MTSQTVASRVNTHSPGNQKMSSLNPVSRRTYDLSRVNFTPGNMFHGNMLPLTCCLKQHVKGNKIVASSLPVCCWIQRDTCCRQHVAWCKRGFRLLTCGHTSNVVSSSYKYSARYWQPNSTQTASNDSLQAFNDFYESIDLSLWNLNVAFVATDLSD